MKYYYAVKCIRVPAAMTAVFLLSGVLQGSADTCEIGTPLTGGKQHCSSNASGKMGGGYTWTIWSSGGGGCITTYDSSGCAFKATWNNSGDFLARTGLGWNETKTYSQLGTITADYAFIKKGSGGSWSYIGIYGWSNNPLVEYYIVEDWFGSGSAPSIYGGTKKGSFTVDGETYNIITHTQVNQPSIHGNATFPQFFSVRQKPRQCGHISISEHFKKWDSLGLKLGKMYEARILVEAAGGNGSIDFTRATLVADTSPPVPVVPRTSWGQKALFRNGITRGVYSLISPTGTVLKSVRLNGSEPAFGSTVNLPNGIYFLKRRGDGNAPVTRTLLLK
ncbi:MAG: glycoside hydrolase family 11 protein [Chitinispirillaceae bacterium]|nr:glycoside hydrolase family 11 protein [Chitinispirillaceae bacterium]